jgi:DNA-directed RNA polymerase specialized sigma24 family protein
VAGPSQGRQADAEDVLQERLSPLERAAFLLHDVFGLEFEEVAATIQRDPAACRQTTALDIEDGKVAAIYVVRNPTS